MINQKKILKEYDIIPSDNENNNDKSITNFDIKAELNDKGEQIEVLHPEDVRWFFRSIESNKNNVLRPFNGYDSLRLETKFQELSSFKGEYGDDSDREKIVVKNNLFEVDVKRRYCSPIYWEDVDDEFEVFRGTWFVHNSYLPLTEALADAVESQHMMQFGSAPLSCFEKFSRKKQTVLHTMEYGDHVIVWYGIDDIYLHSNRSTTKIMQQFKMSSHGQRITRGFKEKALFEDPPIEITHLCFVVHGIGQKLAGKINKQCHKLKHTCQKILKTHFTAEQIRSFRIEFLPIEWRSGLNLDGGIIDSITLREFKGLRTIFNSTLMDILYYSSSLYRTEITDGLEWELNRLYSMFCTRNPYFETKGGTLSILAHSLGAVITYDIIRSWIPMDSAFGHSNVIDQLSNQSEEIMTKIEEISDAKRKIRELEDELRTLAASQMSTDTTDGLRIPNFPSNFKEQFMWKRVKEINNFFAVGSPLPVFLALRGFKPQENHIDNDILPEAVCKRIFNIFHPSDPVAYRLEPLIIKGYKNIKPVHVETLCKNVKDCDQENGTTSSKDASVTRSVFSDSEHIDELKTSNGGIGDSFRVTVASVRRMSTTVTDHISESIKQLNDRRKSIIPAVEELRMKMESIKSLPLFQRIAMFVNILKGDDIKSSDGVNLVDDTSLQELIDGPSTLKNRLDFSLGDEQSISSFLSLFTAHTSYWEDQNLAKFLLDQILSDYNSEPFD